MDTYDFKLNFNTLVESENIAELLDEDALKCLGGRVVEWYDSDKESRSGWEQKTKDALKLAQQVMEEKTYPWRNASNVKFPLLTIASLQFSARVYPALIKVPDLVKYRVMGADPDGMKNARASRVSRYMSYQLLEESESWEEEQDKLFITLPILGSVFKKTYYDSLRDEVKSTLVLPHDLVLHYWTKDLEKARCTERFELYSREVKERQLRGLYKSYEDDFGPGESREKDEELNTDERQGTSLPIEDDDTPREILESHCFWDLDGDGYAEPYIITVDYETGLPLRIINRFKSVTSKQSLQIERLQKQIFLIQESLPSPEEIQQLDAEKQLQVFNMAKRAEAQVMENQQKIEELAAEAPDIIRIEPKVYYTKYTFIPAPDGGYYDIGFGQLLGPLNSSVNSIINQLVDAGTLQNGNSGFIAKGARIAGGTQRFEPFEWKRVSVAGATLKESIVPLPVNQPSTVLFELLGLLINYAERVSSVTDIMQGENPGQNTPAYNMKAMLEQGMQVFNGVFKRIYRAYRIELRKIYALNAEYLPPERYVETQDQEFRLVKADFGGDPKDLVPAADPNAFSDMERLTKAQFVSGRALQVPGYNTTLAEKMLLESMDIPNINELYPTKPDGSLVIPPPPNPEVEMEQADLQRKTLEGKVRGEVDMMNAETDRLLKEAQRVKLMVEARAIEEEAGIERLKLLDEESARVHEERMRRYDEYMKQLDIIMQEKKMETEEKKAEAAVKVANAHAKNAARSNSGGD